MDMIASVAQSWLPCCYRSWCC